MRDARDSRFRSRAAACLAAAALAATAVSARAEVACEASSGERLRPVLELYTSEGCSSCPPADRWLSALAGSPLADQVLPLALHVDYWDYIGWPDRFADKRFTERQRLHAYRNRLGHIYTPQVVLAGRDTPGWARGEAFVDQLRAQAARPAALSLAVSAADGPGEVTARITAAPRSGQVIDREGRLHVGLTADGLSSEVRRGENAGRSLRHDRVVLAWQSSSLARMEEGGPAVLRLPLRAGASAAGLRVFAFAEGADGATLAATECLLADAR